MTEAPFDPARAHRWFAVELNNLAWGLVEADNRSAADTERMIHAAHGACFHWLEAGAPLNHLRAQCLLATAYATAGVPEAAVRHAERCLALSREAGDTQTAFDRATAHGCASVAYCAVGRMDEARAQYELARSFASGFDDPSEHVIFDRLCPAPICAD
jgi:hypothetical protein